MKIYLIILAVVAVYSFVGLLYVNAYDVGRPGITRVFMRYRSALRRGFSATAYEQWPAALVLILLFTAFIGGCTGSTAGGREGHSISSLLFKHAVREIKRLIPPHTGYSLIRVGKTTLPDRVLEAMWGFFAI